jgi:two-component system, NtrC family, response regulator AtoC
LNDHSSVPFSSNLRAAEDIPLLVQASIKKLNRRLNLKIRGVEKEAIEALQSYSWRRNIRELENCIERGSVMTHSDILTREILPSHIAGAYTKARSHLSGGPNGSLSIKERTKEPEVELLSRALQKTNDDRTRAAKILKISHRALLYELKAYGLSKGADYPKQEEGPGEVTG